jgi:putative endonuclease
MPSYVYILSSQRNGTLYIGLTFNLIKRAWEHKINAPPLALLPNEISICWYIMSFLMIYKSLQQEKDD